jgi:hypothetical protein
MIPEIAPGSLPSLLLSQSLSLQAIHFQFEMGLELSGEIGYGTPTVTT